VHVSASCAQLGTAGCASWPCQLHGAARAALGKCVQIGADDGK